MDVALERRIRERIRGFDVPALLDVLSASGYGDAGELFRNPGVAALDMLHHRAGGADRLKE